MQDLHIHTTFSDGSKTIEQILQSTSEISIGISDHIFCKKLSREQDVVNYIQTLRSFPIYCGGEINLGELHLINTSVLERFDYIIGSIHGVKINNRHIHLGKYFDYRDKKKYLHPDYIFTDYDCCTALDNILKIYENDFKTSYINILGHCTVTPFYQQVNSKYRYQWEKETVQLCKKYNIAIEVSGLWQEPGIDFIKKAYEQNVKISFGSDCHREYTLSYTDYFNYALNLIDINKEGVFTIEK